MCLEVESASLLLAWAKHKIAPPSDRSTLLSGSLEILHPHIQEEEDELIANQG